MLSDSAKEKLVDKRKVREMQHATGVRYLAIGLGDTALYMLAGMMAALVFSLRVFLLRGTGKAN